MSMATASMPARSSAVSPSKKPLSESAERPSAPLCQ